MAEIISVAAVIISGLWGFYRGVDSARNEAVEKRLARWTCTPDGKKEFTWGKWE